MVGRKKGLNKGKIYFTNRKYQKENNLTRYLLVVAVAAIVLLYATDIKVFRSIFNQF